MWWITSHTQTSWGKANSNLLWCCPKILLWSPWVPSKPINFLLRAHMFPLCTHSSCRASHEWVIELEQWPIVIHLIKHKIVFLETPTRGGRWKEESSWSEWVWEKARETSCINRTEVKDWYSPGSLKHWEDECPRLGKWGASYQGRQVMDRRKGPGPMLIC